CDTHGRSVASAHEIVTGAGATDAAGERSTRRKKCQPHATLLPHAHASIGVMADTGGSRPPPASSAHHGEGRVRTAGWSLVLLGAVAPGISGAAVPRALTLAEALVMAARNDVSVVRADGDARNASASVRSAYGAFLPNLAISGGTTRQLGDLG